VYRYTDSEKGEEEPLKEGLKKEKTATWKTSERVENRRPKSKVWEPQLGIVHLAKPVQEEQTRWKKDGTVIVWRSTKGGGEAKKKTKTNNARTIGWEKSQGGPPRNTRNTPNMETNRI